MEDYDDTEFDPNDSLGDDVIPEVDVFRRGKQGWTLIPTDTSPGKKYMTKNEFARLKSARARQIESGSPPKIKLDGLDVTRSDLIAERELLQKVIPMKLVRTHNNFTYEIWDIKDMVLPKQ